MKLLEKMKLYNEKTSEAGIIMPNIDTFDRKMLMAIKLWPQIGKNGDIQYLLGKGVGVEVAIRGEVKGRRKRNNDFPYRSHSDFEIYDCVGYKNLPESDAFTFVFGWQEYRSKTETKGLQDMDPTLMDTTYETVIYKGQEYLVPELEILFLDKFLLPESTPREEGNDALLLLKEYELDMEKVLDYFDKYYCKAKSEEFIVPSKIHEFCLQKLTKTIPTFIQNYLEEEGKEVTLENISKRVNDDINGALSTSTYLGMPVACCPKKIDYTLDKDGNIDLAKETKEELKRLVLKQRERQEDALEDIRNEIVDMFEMVKKQYKKPSTKQIK